ncbi:MAG: flavodoxin [Lachnospiraceae bacterium]|nr:flavodoxin [Lachnospiraceae bacterium]
MKKLVALLLSLSMIFALSACGSQNSGNDTATSLPGNESAEVVTEAPTEELTEAPTEASTEMDTEEPSEDTESAEGKTLVVYYSATGNTEEAASYIAAATGADTLELVPVEPYTDEDLNYNDDGSRVVYEHNNPEARDVELVEATVSDWESYDTVFIGYPIWWGIAAWPVDTFIEANDFTGKTVIPFCTSASSELGESGELLAEAAGTGEWLEGIRFSSSVSEADVQTWLEDLGM